MLKVLNGLDFMMTENEIQLCSDYWSIVDNPKDYCAHVTQLCNDYDISGQELYKTILLSYAYLDDVVCSCCGMGCPIYLPAEGEMMRKLDKWTCDHCLPPEQQANLFYPI